ncbi:uncharacterized protein ISCGN_010274 [Ixodes scapularis]
MGRSKQNPVRKYFKYDLKLDRSACQIGECNVVMSSNHAANLERHIHRCHAREYAQLELEKLSTSKRARDDSVELQPKRRDQPSIRDALAKSPGAVVNITSKTLMDGCVELVTKNGRPFRLIDGSGFQKIVDPILKGLKEKTSINSENVRAKVNQEAQEARDNISRSLKDRLISLKMDCATRLDRAILGINVQYIKDGKLVLRALAMKELFERHTAECLKTEVMKVLSAYNVKVEQVYSITTDNGANMLKTGELLKECSAEESESSYSENEESDERAKCAGESRDAVFGSFEGTITLDDDGPLLQGMRCAAHTLQLAVHDTLKEPTLADFIKKSRTLSKKLRSQTIMSLIRKLKLKKPVIDCSTRWMSTVLMLRRLLELREFCDDLFSADDEVHFTEEDWLNTEQIVLSFSAAEAATKVLQREQLTMGDFYGTWLKCRMQTSKVDSPIATALVAFMKRREKWLLGNNLFCAAIYLDPRYHVSLSSDEKSRAKQHLMRTWEQMKTASEQPRVRLLDSPDSSDRAETLSADDDLELFLKEREEGSSESRTKSSRKSAQIERLLESFEREPRIKKEANVLEFWRKEKPRFPELYQLAVVALAVPATQVSVERAFSGLKYILSCQRTRLTPTTLDDVLLLRSVYANKQP